MPTYIEVQYKHSAWEPSTGGEDPSMVGGGSKACDTGLMTCIREPFRYWICNATHGFEVMFIIDGQ